MVVASMAFENKASARTNIEGIKLKLNDIITGLDKCIIHAEGGLLINSLKQERTKARVVSSLTKAQHFLAELEVLIAEYNLQAAVDKSSGNTESSTIEPPVTDIVETDKNINADETVLLETSSAHHPGDMSIEKTTDFKTSTFDGQKYMPCEENESVKQPLPTTDYVSKPGEAFKTLETHTRGLKSASTIDCTSRTVMPCKAPNSINPCQQKKLLSDDFIPESYELEDKTSKPIFCDTFKTIDYAMYDSPMSPTFSEASTSSVVPASTHNSEFTSKWPPKPSNDCTLRYDNSLKSLPLEDSKSSTNMATKQSTSKKSFELPNSLEKSTIKSYASTSKSVREPVFSAPFVNTEQPVATGNRRIRKARRAKTAQAHNTERQITSPTRKHIDHVTDGLFQIQQKLDSFRKITENSNKQFYKEAQMLYEVIYKNYN